MSDKTKIATHLRMIRTAVHELQALLPEEQLHRGSELQRLDSLNNDLYWKYIMNADEQEEQSHE